VLSGLGHNHQHRASGGVRGVDRGGFGVSLENAARARIKGADGAWIDIDALMPLGVQG